MSSLIGVRDLQVEVEGYPHLRWDEVARRVAHVPADRQTEAWAEATRFWLESTVERLGGGFAVYESERVQLLAAENEEFAGYLLRHIERTQHSLAEMFPDVVRFDEPGKSVVLAYPDAELYYSYLAAFYPQEGAFGGSAGCQLRLGYPHIVVCGSNMDVVRGILSHEVTHAGLQHLDAPGWLEEGVTQLVEHAAMGRPDLVMTEEIARKQKRHWSHHGLAPFWWGTGFHVPGKMQTMSYQLAEVLMRILFEEARPAWFGLFGRKSQVRLHGFLRNAKAADAGQAAALEHLGYPLGGLAAKFLGPGEWDPSLTDATSTEVTG